MGIFENGGPFLYRAGMVSCALVLLAPSASAEEAQTEPGQDADAESTADDDKGPGFGMYFEANGAALFGTSSSHEWKDNCPALSGAGASWDPECSTSAPKGLMIDSRLGLRFGYLGVEAIALFAGDWSQAKFDQDIPGLSGEASKMQIGRVGGGLGGGLRLMTAPGLARIGLGVGGGVMFRHVYTSISSLDGSSVGYQAPFLMADVTVTLLRFVNVGIVGMAEFNKNVAVDSNFAQVGGATGAQLDSQIGQVSVFQKTSIFIGPRIGLHLGG